MIPKANPEKFGLRHRILRIIVQYKRAHDGNSPTLRKISELSGGHSVSVIDYHIKRLEKAGYLRKTSPRDIELVGGRYEYAPKASELTND